MASPRPSPPLLRASEWSPWTKGWNKWGSRSGWMPLPVSLILITACCFPVSLATVTKTSSFLLVNFKALCSKLLIVCRNLTESACRCRALGQRITLSLTPFSVNSCLKSDTACCINSFKSTISFFSRALFCEIREISSKSFTNRDSCSAWRSMICRASQASSLSGVTRFWISIPIIIEARGLRSSCDMILKNWLRFSSLWRNWSMIFCFRSDSFFSVISRMTCRRILNLPWLSKITLCLTFNQRYPPLFTCQRRSRSCSSALPSKTCWYALIVWDLSSGWTRLVICPRDRFRASSALKPINRTKDGLI